MVRNLVLTAVANHDLKEQEQFYYQYWLKPIEEKVKTSVTEFLYKFVEKFDFKHESKTEIFSKQYLKDKPDQQWNIMAYAKFYSLLEWRLQTDNESKKSTSDVDSELLIHVIKEILSEMANDLSEAVEEKTSFEFKKPTDQKKPKLYKHSLDPL